MAKQIFVSPNPKGWKVKVVGNQKASAICKMKANAIKRAIEIARNQRLELSVQNKDGTIGIKNSYGHDPENIKG